MEFGMIHHVAIQTGDYDRSRAFYVDKLGFEVLGEYVFPSGTRRLDCRRGSAQLEIFWSERVQPRPQQLVQGFRHLCFRVENMDAAVAALLERGIAVEEIRADPMAGGRMTFFQDPDGLELELHE